MPRPRKQVIDALRESNTDRMMHEYDQEFVTNMLSIMLLDYMKTKNLKLLAMGCKTIIKTIEKK